jgi:hypothetical protein
MNENKNIKVQVTFHITQYATKVVEIPVEGLTKCEDGLYEGDEIKDQANKLAYDLIKREIGSCGFSSIHTEETVIVNIPDDIEVWY